MRKLSILGMTLGAVILVSSVGFASTMSDYRASLTSSYNMLTNISRQNIYGYDINYQYSKYSFLPEQKSSENGKQSDGLVASFSGSESKHKMVADNDSKIITENSYTAMHIPSQNFGNHRHTMDQVHTVNTTAQA